MWNLLGVGNVGPTMICPIIMGHHLRILFHTTYRGCSRKKCPLIGQFVDSSQFKFYYIELGSLIQGLNWFQIIIHGLYTTVVIPFSTCGTDFQDMHYFDNR